MTRLFRDLGWPETPESDQHHRTFQCTNGTVIGLYAAENYAPHFGPPAEGFRGIVLSVNVGSFEEVQSIHASLQGIDGVELLEEPAEAFWGGGFSWRDPEGNDWDVAWAKDATFDERGGVFFP
jgi:uncharacterized glyoxalase superfamily protein PhnB